ncbi:MULTISPECIES: hypothetical protein [unclassified Butyrivibrio]|uniref:hypothetical protein n=1 Tax=unclassified Butyrivibrio TaxID=2639466 RepID=UPI000406AA4F|nr:MULTISPECIES: hypothetical protein [unclassified Butyrivibrio]
MESYSKQLKQQMKEIESLIDKTERRARNYIGLENKLLRVSNRKNGYHYYIVEGDSKPKYVKDKDKDLARKIAQRDYEEKTLKTMRNLNYQINRFLQLYDSSAIENVYEHMGEARKAIVEPIIPSDEEYIKNWLKQHEGEKNLYPEHGRYVTAKGEYVRSKSEKILADLFNKYEIPYCYEPALELRGGKIVYPDFIILNVRKRKTYYWEHLGLVSEEDYAIKNFGKLQLYEKSGYIVGDRVLISMESESNPLDVRIIEKKIKTYLL